MIFIRTRTARPVDSISGRSGFTMVEIALCLAIIGFALVAIIGVLPSGMGVQKDNREETIIDKDASVWMDVIHNGSRGYNDLTNYVMLITNSWTTYLVSANSTNKVSNGSDVYNITSSTVGNRYALTNGANIVGVLSTPQILSPPPFNRLGSFQSNYVVAYVRAISGPAVEKAPQNNPDVLSGGFAYKMIVENIAYVPAVFANPQIMASLQSNSRDLRITFRWPFLPNGAIGNGRQTFRTFAGGALRAAPPLYFFEPSTYVGTP